MTRFAAIAVYASIVSAARVIIVPSAAFARTVWIWSASAVTAVHSVPKYARNAAKNAKPVPTMRYAVNAASVLSA